MYKLMAVVMGLVVLAGTVVLATPPTVVTVAAWQEDAARYNPNGTLIWEVSGYSVGPVEFRRTGKAYHMLDINPFYAGAGRSSFQGEVVVSGGGHLSAHVTFLWDSLNLRGREHIKGNVTIDSSMGSFEGTYVAYTYAFGSANQVLAEFPEAIPEKSSQARGWWLVFYTHYKAY